MYEDYLNRLKSSGYKITPQRRELLKALSANKMKTAEELHNQVTSNQPNVSLDTIYRNLHLLQQLNIISEINLGDGKNRFRLNSSSHNHHMICINCGRLQELNFCPMEFLEDKIDSKKFKVTNHSFEIFGYCSNCS
uniref:Fur family transcriptional regulator n=1 Tax=Desulforadius tongensis TaxID=1216062 RepID=UPI001EE5A04E|nr:Fur family transcriptional regulator [Desulforadius tongensis]